MDNISGSVIKGYELRERIGTGGFGAVYRAYQSTIGREVALKIILPHFANQPDFIRRFETEAQLIARLEHWHIVPLYDYWRDPNGAYLVMRWFRGGSLQEVLKQGNYSLSAAALFVDQLASALTLVHHNHIIHRDLKPANILLDEDGNHYLGDFGIAKDVKVLDGALTQADTILGSPDYLAPEQVRGEPVSPKTDIYSFGVVLYEVLAGKPPFVDSSTIERLYKHLNEPLPRLTDLSADVLDAVNTVIQTATAKDPAQRYADVNAFATAFRAAIQSLESDASLPLVETLTQREQDILVRIIEGLSNKQIADDLFISLPTVKWYIRHIYSKLGVHSRVQAIVRARELNLIVGSSSSDALLTMIESPRGTLPEPTNPYKGLEAFQSVDYDRFFGREALIQKLLKRLTEARTMSGTARSDAGPLEANQARLLAILGPSGTGKSSVVKAGLIPALWRGEISGSEKWFVVEMRPGTRPFDELEIALSRVTTGAAINLHDQLQRDQWGLLRAAQMILPADDSELVLIIDQFEEVFTLVAEEVVRTRFLDMLIATVTDPRSRLQVVLTLRADFYDRPLRYPHIGDIIQSRLVTVLPLTPEGLEGAIIKPAEQQGVTFEDGLTAKIISEMNYQPGALPLLQYALTELFEQREGRLLTNRAYQEIGGAVGALAKRAEHLYAEMSPADQELTHQMFLRLVTTGDGTNDARIRVRRAELLSLAADADAMDEVIDTFASYRLLSLDHDEGTRSPTVEVAHEAILREWPRLSTWINDSREDIKTRQQLDRTAEEWQEKGKETSYLASGQRLAQFENWASSKRQALTSMERAYLEASVAERTQLDRVETERKARETRLERRSRQVLRGLVVVLLLATLGAFGLTGAAVNASQLAEAQTRIAQSRELVGYARDNLDTDGELSTLLALQAVNLTYKVDGTVLPEAEAALHQSLQNLHSPLRFSSAGGIVFGEFAGLSPDGTRFVYPLKTGGIYGEMGVTGIADPRSGKLLYQIPGDVWTTYISAKNQVIIGARVGDTMQLQLWDIASSNQPTRLSSVDEPSELWHGDDGTFVIQADVISISPDLRSIFAVMAADGRIRIWDLSSGKEIVTPATRQIADGNGHPLFSPDGTRLGRSNPDGTLSILDTATWEEIAHFASPNASISPDNDFRFSEDGQRIAAINKDNTITLWDTATGTALYAFYPAIVPNLLAINADGTRVAVANSSGQVAIWNTTTRQEELAYGTSDELYGMRLSSDGLHLSTVHETGQVQLWDLVPGREALTLVNNDSDEDLAAVGLAYSPDGQRLLATGTSTTPNVWDVETGQKLLALVGHTGRVRAVDWSADGKLLATGGEDDNVLLWDAATGAVRLTLAGHTDTVFAVAFSPDSRYLATSSFDGSLRVWDVDTDKLVFTSTQEGVKQSRGIAWSPDGQHLANVTYGIDEQHLDQIYILNALTGETEHDIELPGNGTIQEVMYSPDGSRIAAAATGWQEYFIYDPHSGEQLMTLPGHGVLTSDIAFSPDGTLIATGGFDNLAQIWDATTGKERLRLFTPTGDAYRVAFSPDGTRLAVQGEDSATRIYVLPITDLTALAKSRLTRTLTTEECHQYLHTDVCPAG